MQQQSPPLKTHRVLSPAEQYATAHARAMRRTFRGIVTRHEAAILRHVGRAEEARR